MDNASYKPSLRYFQAHRTIIKWKMIVNFTLSTCSMYNNANSAWCKTQVKIHVFTKLFKFSIVISLVKQAKNISLPQMYLLYPFKKNFHSIYNYNLSYSRMLNLYLCHHPANFPIGSIYKTDTMSHSIKKKTNLFFSLQ